MLIRQEFHSPLILCVDDDQRVLSLTSQALREIGFRVLVADSGREALDLFARFPIDAVVLDYEMPGMSGGKVAQEMCRIKPEVPKMLFSGTWGVPKDELEAFQGYCRKPSGLHLFSAQVCELVAHQYQA